MAMDQTHGHARGEPANFGGYLSSHFSGQPAFNIGAPKPLFFPSKNDILDDVRVTMYPNRTLGSQFRSLSAGLPKTLDTMQTSHCSIHWQMWDLMRFNQQI